MPKRYSSNLLWPGQARLGVDADTARNDAEGIEHHVSDKTLKAFERFLKKP